MAKATAKAINAAIKALGHDEIIWRGEGYYYFCEGDAHMWPETMVYCCYLNQMTLEQWIEAYKGLRARYEATKA